MLGDITDILKIITFLLTIFLQWPVIKRRFKESYPTTEKLLMTVSIIAGFTGLVFIGLALFKNGPLLLLYLSLGMGSSGISFLIGNFVQKNRGSSPVFSKWVVGSMLVMGVLGILDYWLSLS